MLLALATSENVWSLMKRTLFHAKAVYKSGRGLLRKLYDVYQEHGTTSSPSFFEFLRTTPSLNETTTATMNQMFFDTINPHEHDPRDKIEK